MKNQKYKFILCLFIFLQFASITYCDFYSYTLKFEIREGKNYFIPGEQFHVKIGLSTSASDGHWSYSLYWDDNTTPFHGPIIGWNNSYSFEMPFKVEEEGNQQVRRMKIYAYWSNNVELHEETKTITIYIDRDLPQVSITSPDPSTWFSEGSIPIKFVANDNTSGIKRVDIYINGSRKKRFDLSTPRKTYSNQYNWTPSGDGTHSFYIIAYDAVGRNKRSYTRYFYVDTQLPAVLITQPTDNSWLKGGETIPISFQAIDATSGIDYVDLLVDGTPVYTFNTTSGTYNWTIPEITWFYSIEAIAADKVGHTSSDYITVNIDSTPPVVYGPPIVEDAVNGFTNTTPVIWTWNESFDAESGFDHYFALMSGPDLVIPDSERYVTVTTFSHEGRDGMTYTGQYSAYDAVGNYTESGTTQVSVDMSVQDVPLSLHPLIYNQGEVDFRWDPIEYDFAGLDYYEVFVSVNDAVPDDEDIIEVHIPDSSSGEWHHTFEGLSIWQPFSCWVRGVDILGNKGAWTKTMIFPDFKITGPADGIYTNQVDHIFNITGNLVDPDISLKYRVFRKEQNGLPIDSGNFTSGPTVISFSGEGIWKWWLEVGEFEDDTDTPIVTHVTDIATFSIDVNPPSRVSFSLSSPDGLKVYSASAPTNQREVLINNIFLEDNNGIVRSGIKGVYVWNGNELAPSEDAFYYSAGMIPAEGIPWELPEEDGIHTVRMQAVDLAGNKSASSYDVALDRTPPGEPTNIGYSFTGNGINFTWETTLPNDDITVFQGLCFLPDGTEQPFAIDPSTTKEGSYLLELSNPGSNQAVTIEIVAVDWAGNESSKVQYIAYTQAIPASPDDFELIGGGYNQEIGSVYSRWRLLEQGGAASHILEYGELVDGEFSSAGVIEGDENSIYTHDSYNGFPLSSHTVYYYRPAALNTAGDIAYGTVFTQKVPNNPPTLPVCQSPYEYSGEMVSFVYEDSTDYDNDQLTYTIYLGEGQNPAVFNEIDGDSVSGLVNGIVYTWYVLVNDGYTDVAGEPASFIVDIFGPALILGSITRPYTNQDTVTVSVSDSESGVANASYKVIDPVNGETIEEGEITLSEIIEGILTGEVVLPEGAYNLQINAVDLAGNTSTQNANDLIVDRQPPVLEDMAFNTTLYNGSLYSVTGRIPASFTAVDNLSGIKTFHYWVLEHITDERGQSTVIPLSSGVSDYDYILGSEDITASQIVIAYALEDKAANMSEPGFSEPILIDRSTPEINFSISGGSLTQYQQNYYLSDFHNLDKTISVEDPESGVKEITYALLDNTNNELISAWTTWENITVAAPDIGKSYRILVRGENNAGGVSKKQSIPFVFDTTPPVNIVMSGLSDSYTSGETCFLHLHAEEAESVIQEYRLAVGTIPGSYDISANIEGNTDGWLVKNTNNPDVYCSFIIPRVNDGTCFVTLSVTNAPGLSSVVDAGTFTIDNTISKLIVTDDGPFTMFDDRLSCSWMYTGSESIETYDYRIVSDGFSIIDWKNTTKSQVVETGLSLETGKKYFFEVRVHFEDSSSSDIEKSNGVIVDTTSPVTDRMNLPVFATSDSVYLECIYTDNESGIVSSFIAVGSAAGTSDVSKGWLQITHTRTYILADAEGNAIQYQNGNNYYIMIRLTNGAGLVSTVFAGSVTIDDTPPPLPVVNDQGGYINTLQPLEFDWLWSLNDPESGSSYSWSILNDYSAIEEAEWTSSDNTKTIKLDDFQQQHGQTYYLAVKAVNGAGLESIGISDGIMVDETAPYLPVVKVLNGITTDILVYTQGSDDLLLSIESSDPESPIDGYRYGWGTEEDVLTSRRYESPVSLINIDTITLNEGEITYFIGECTNKAELVSGTGISKGLMLDTGAPVITNVRSVTSGNTIFFDWEVFPSYSPVTGYEVAFVSADKINDSPASWDPLGTIKKYTVAAEDYQDGSYVLIVRGKNAAGTYSPKASWGISNPVVIDNEKPEILEILISAQYESEDFSFTVSARDNVSGINSYRYTLGTISDPFAFSGDWKILNDSSNFVTLSFSSDFIPHGDSVYLTIQAKDTAGLWSDPSGSPGILIDKTAPALTSLTCNEYSTGTDQIQNISFTSDDPESGITHYRMGIVSQIGEQWQNVQYQPLSLFTGTLSGLNLVEGEKYYVAMQTQNGAELWSDIIHSNPFSIDTVGPVIEFENGDTEFVVNKPPANCYYNLSEDSQVFFTLTADDGTSVSENSNITEGLQYYTFTQSKIQNYTLTAYGVDKAGNIGDESIFHIRVNSPPSVTLEKSKNISIGETIVFNAIVTDADGIPELYEWDPGDGSALLTGVNPSYVYTEEGLYTVILTVTDNDGGITSDSMQIMVGNTTAGPLFVDEVWNGIHRIYDDVIVPEDLTLTILPGTQVIVDGIPGETGYFHMLNIKGTLNARGGNEGITFVSVTGDFDGWKGILIEGEAVLEHVTINHAQQAVGVAKDADVSISECVFEYNFIGIHVVGAAPVINLSDFKNNKWYGIKEDDGAHPVVTECLFSGNRRDYYRDPFTSITIDELNEINGNYGNRKE